MTGILPNGEPGRPILEPMPRALWSLGPDGHDHFVVRWLGWRKSETPGFWSSHPQRWRITDFPNFMFGLDDLDRFGLLELWIAAKARLRARAGATPAPMASPPPERIAALSAFLQAQVGRTIDAAFVTEAHRAMESASWNAVAAAVWDARPDLDCRVRPNAPSASTAQ